MADFNIDLIKIDSEPVIADHFKFISSAYNRVFKRDLKNFDRQKSIEELRTTDGQTVVSFSSDDPNLSFNLFESKINSLIENYMPLKKLSNRGHKLERKP